MSQCLRGVAESAFLPGIAKCKLKGLTYNGNIRESLSEPLEKFIRRWYVHQGFPDKDSRN